MIKKIRGYAQKLRLRRQLLLVILVSGAFAFLLFQTLWQGKYQAYETLRSIPFLPLPVPDENLVLEAIVEEARNLELPESENDAERIALLQPLFDIADEYTSISLYGLTDRLFLAGSYASAMDDPFFRPFFDIGYRATSAYGEEVYTFPAEFKNGYAEVYLYFYHSAWFFYPYLLFCLLLCVVCFLLPVLYFIGRKAKHILLLEKEILRMSSGDLEHTVPVCGFDEIGVLGRELDRLRLTLSENIRQEQESRRANQDLIAAMSHDLRTPLTILNGYLEVLKLKRNPDMEEEYLQRCLKKATEIREMTDRMFEYALVYEGNEEADLLPLPFSLLEQCLTENADYIRLTGFEADCAVSGPASCRFYGDEAMLRRIFSNLFSNIIKYGDKKIPVQISCIFEDDGFSVTLVNGVRQEYARIESNRIGLRSVQKMMELMNAGFQTEETESSFCVRLRFAKLPE